MRRDLESTNVDAAAHLAAEADYHPSERPSRAELAADDAEMARFYRELYARRQAEMRS